MTDKGSMDKMEALQKMISDPKSIEKIMSQVTPEQVSAALNFFSSLDPNSKKAIGGLLNNLGGAKPKTDQ